MMIIIIVHNK